jgi:hypothetical protein
MSSHRSSPKYSARASSGDPVPASSAPTARATPASTSSGWVTAASGTNAVPAPKRSTSRSPTATASRVLPIPPSPVRVTNRTPGLPAKSATSAMAASRPTSEVASSGSGRGPCRLGDAAAAAGGRAAANRSLSSIARSSRTSRPSSPGVRKCR